MFNTIAVAISVAILVPLLGKLVTKRGGERLTEEELARLSNISYPQSVKRFYFLTVIFLIMGIMAACFIPFYLLIELAPKNNIDGIPAIFRFFLFILFAIGNLLFFTWIIDSFFYKIASKTQRDFLVYMQAKNGFKLTMQSSLSFIFRFATIFYLLTIALSIIGFGLNIIRF